MVRTVIDAIKPYLIEIKFALAMVLLAAAFLAGHHVGELSSKAALAESGKKAAEATTTAVKAARAVEQKQADGFASIDAKYLGDLSYAQALSSRTVAGLRDGSVQLRQTWRCPAAASVPAPTAAPSQRDAGTDDRAESAGRIVRAADDADAQIRALQAILQAEREGQQ